MRFAGVCGALGLLASSCTLTLEFDGLAESKTETEDASIECASVKSKGKPECNVVANLEPGSIGSGIVIDWKHAPEREVTSGFVDGNELVVAVSVGLGEDEGAIVAVSLANGERKLVAGMIQDANGTPLSQGGGSALADIAAIAPVDAGGWVAHLWNGFTMLGTRISVDPLTGDRGPGIFVGQECPEENLHPNSRSSIVAADGSIFLPYQAFLPDEYGIAKLTDTSCELIPMPGADPNVLARVGDRIWFLDATARVGELDPLTGDVTWVPGPGGYPPGLAALFTDGDTAWTIGTDPSLFYDRVDTATGETSRITLALGPAALQVRHAPHLWPHPDGQQLVLSLDGAVVVLNPTTGQSSIVSY